VARTTTRVPGVQQISESWDCRLCRCRCDCDYRPAATTMFHAQERDLAIEPWPVQLYGTVCQQQFVKLTACIRLGASSKHICLLYA